MNLLIMVMISSLLKDHMSECFRLTNLTAPAVQDPRSEMHLHCQFEMGGEELYAVKWYKDDHEFFRYTPSGDDMVTFPLAGVHVNSARSSCNRNSCDLFLINVRRPESSGSYRCEVSSEAPAFRLASQTRKVTVAALPDDPPTIQDLKKVYTFGDMLTATCTSGFGDPKPDLKLYINNQEVPMDFVTNIDTESSLYHDQYDDIYLKKTKIQVSVILDGRVNDHMNTPNELKCSSSADGIKPSEAPTLTTTRTFDVVDQTVNNQKYQWADQTSRADTVGSFSKLILNFSLLANLLYYLSQ